MKQFSYDPPENSNRSSSTFLAATIVPESYVIGECRESITGIGVVWTVYKMHGTRCGCGAIEMQSSVAFFPDRAEAEEYVRRKNGARA